MYVRNFSKSSFFQLDNIFRKCIIHYVVIAVFNGTQAGTMNVSVFHKCIIQSDPQIIRGLQATESIDHGRDCCLDSLFSVVRMLVNKGNSL